MPDKDAGIAFPSASKTEASSTVPHDTVSTPLGVPVIERKNLIDVSPPVNADALLSDVLSCCVKLVKIAFVAFPPF